MLYHVVCKCALPELQYSCGIEGRIDPPHKVEVTHVQVALSITGYGHRRQQLVALCHPTAAWARDAASSSVTHNAVNDGRLLLGEEDVLAAALMKNSCVK